MKIHNLHLTSYGKFKDKTISFSDGINLIYGPNEAGKSTLMAFIKAMLYGFTGRGAEGDRKRYIPWDGNHLAGEMTVSLSDGRKVIISRRSGKTPAQDEFRALDAVTGEALAVDFTKEIGFGEGAFGKTLFIRQSGAMLDGGDEELTDRLLNLAEGGSADTGYEDAMGILRDNIRALKHQRGEGGRIHELKKEITALQEEIRLAEEEAEKYKDYAAEEKRLQAEIGELQKREAEAEKTIRAALAGQAFANLAAAEKRVRGLHEGKEQIAAEIAALQKRLLETEVFSGEISDSVYAAKADIQPFLQAEKAAARQSTLTLCLAGILGIGGVAAFFLQNSLAGTVLLFAAFLSAVLGCMRLGTGRKAGETIARLTEEEKAREAALLAFGCKTLKEYTEKKADRRADEEKLQALSEKNELLLKECAAAEKEATVRRKEAEGFVDIAPALQDPEAARAASEGIKAEIADKSHKAAMLRGILKGGQGNKKSIDVLLSERSHLEEELVEAEEELEALELAAGTLEEVFAELSRDFAPRISEKATHYLAKLTGREEKLLLDKKYAVTMGRDMHRPLSLFSGGTMEQAFLAVRLAIAELVLTDKNMPLFLDDSFLQYDSGREENAIRLLRELAEDRQVFWFSCRRQELEDINRVEL